MPGELRRRAQQAQSTPEPAGWDPADAPSTSTFDPALAAASATGRPVATVNLPDEEPDPGWQDSSDTDPDKVAVHVAWARVMNDVRFVAKNREANITTSGGGSYRFNYRGIDQILNAAGPAIRRHGVMVIPVDVDASYASAGKMREVTVKVTYEIWGPMGERCIRAVSQGEALDTSERGTTKALTNAYRSLLVAALALPTVDPKLDPDRSDHQRPEVQGPTPGMYVEEMLNTKRPPTLRRMQQIRRELEGTPQAAAIVQNETGDDERLWDLMLRVGRRRQDEERGLAAPQDGPSE